MTITIIDKKTNQKIANPVLESLPRINEHILHQDESYLVLNVIHSQAQTTLIVEKQKENKFFVI